MNESQKSDIDAEDEYQVNDFLGAESTASMSADVTPLTGGSPAAQGDSVTGRFALAVEMTSVGISLRPVFVAENGETKPMAVAVFPTLEYALNQLDQAKILIAQRYELAARAGATALANNLSDASAGGAV